MRLAAVVDLAPPTPPCFPARMQWVEYLHQCQQSKRDALRPFAADIYRPAFNFCRDCTRDHRAAMTAAGRCKPQVFSANAQVPEQVSE